jgi:FtsZ-interacting cell division protein ZipA
MPAWLIWVIVIVVIVVIAAALFAMIGKRRSVQKRERAEELRQEATTQASGLSESQRQAEELRAKADLARAEAQRAEHQAANAEQGHRVEQASYEDKLREADRLDPEVDHKAGDYQPEAWNDQRPQTTAADTETTRADRPRAEVTDPTTARHAAAPEEAPEQTKVAQHTEDPEAEAAASADESRRDAR